MHGVVCSVGCGVVCGCVCGVVCGIACGVACCDVRFTMYDITCGVGRWLMVVVCAVACIVVCATLRVCCYVSLCERCVCVLRDDVWYSARCDVLRCMFCGAWCGGLCVVVCVRVYTFRCAICCVWRCAR